MQVQKLVIQGGNKLSGTIKINGAKNSVVALLPAAILSDEESSIYNVPNITDVEVLKQIIELLNGKLEVTEDFVKIDSKNIINTVIPEELSNKLRASYYFMGALLSRFKHVEIYFPGGCNFGARQIDYHLKGFEALGATITMDGNKFIIDAKELKGTEIALNFASVGATINLMLAAVKAEGTTTIYNAAKEPEIVNVASFLNNMGAHIRGAGTSTIQIKGVKKLGSAIVDVIPDRIEAGTYLIAGALLGDHLKIANIIPEHLASLLVKLKEMNVNYTQTANEIIISKCEELKATDIKTGVYPGYPTDLAQPICVLLAKAQGISHVTETIYTKRMGHVEYLKRMGANIEIIDNTEIITGPTKFYGTDVEASDLRAGATLFLAALAAEGKTNITNIQYILRGYENLVKKLANVGANIRIEEIE